MRPSWILAAVAGLGACTDPNPTFETNTTDASSAEGSSSASTAGDAEGGSVSTVSTGATSDSGRDTTASSSSGSDATGSSSGVTTDPSASSSETGTSESGVGESSTSAASTESSSEGAATTGGVSIECFAVDDCADDEFCDWPEATPCGWNAQMPGTCTPRPESCPNPDPQPATGCDCGPLYPSACAAQMAGFDVACFGQLQCC